MVEHRGHPLPQARRAALVATAVVLVHGLPLVLHSAAHVNLGIRFETLPPNLYVALVLFAAPVFACVLLWTASAQRQGAWLFLASMIGSLAFEVYNHFMVIGPDHVSQMPPGPWGRIFVQTAVASALLEVVGCAAAVYCLAIVPKRSKIRDSRS